MRPEETPIERVRGENPELSSADWLLLALSSNAIGLGARESLPLNRLCRVLESIDFRARRDLPEADLPVNLASSLEYSGGETGRKLGLEQPAVTRHLEEMVNLGLAEEIEDPRQTTRFRYQITDEGDDLAASLMNSVDRRLVPLIPDVRKESALRVRLRHITRDIKITNPEGRLAKLAQQAQKEVGDWEYRVTKTAEPRPILASYLNYLYRAVSSQGKVLQATNENGEEFACFNTRLMTPHFQRLHAVASENAGRKHEYQPRWFLIGFFEPSHPLLSIFEKEPEPPTFFGKPAELVYDTGIDLRIDYEHVLGDNIDRYPAQMRDSWDQRHRAVDTATERALRRLELNWKTAIPQFYWGRDGEEEGQLQLLLPLCLVEYDEADLALVVARKEAAYIGHTCLTLDMAYNNARLIARPDTEWLNP
jgi:DNA-binding MarR family transcriptional regulator